MSVPLKQAAKVGAYIAKQKVLGIKKYPLVLMLEPLFRCNLSCTGCGKIQFPNEILKKYVTAKQALNAANECGAPIVSIAGGEPLIHPEIKEIVNGLIDQKRFIYLCTNALMFKRKMDLFKPSEYLTWSIHLDGIESHHDQSVDKKGVYKIAIEAIHLAKEKGFRVMTNTTIFQDHPVEDIQTFFDEMTRLKTDGMMISPGYSYKKAPVQDRFLKRNQTKEYFKKVFAPLKKRGWKFNHSPLYLDFLQGKQEYQCTPWGNPTYNIFGWQRPCYLFSERGYAKTFNELMEETDWENYGVGRHEKCEDCMVHCGFEPTAVEHSMKSPKNILRSLTSSL